MLHYWLKNAVIDAGFQSHTKGRIQTGFSAPLNNAVEIYSKQRVFIHADMNHLNSYPPTADQWWLGMILEELWSGAPWLGDANTGRMVLIVTQESSGEETVVFDVTDWTYDPAAVVALT